MTLAQRVRDQRYAKGWGPDELANRASISRTALYQIESGKTGHPRAGTLRRIAEALSLSTEALLGPTDGLETVSVAWLSPSEETPREDSVRFGSFAGPDLSRVNGRERDLERKFQELLRSPLGDGLARIVEESFRLLPGRAEASR